MCELTKQRPQYEHQVTHPQESESGQRHVFAEAVPAVALRHQRVHRPHVRNGGHPFLTVQGAIDFDFSVCALIGNEIKSSMQSLFDQCKQMMDVSDKEIETYREERQKIKKEIPIDYNANVKKYQEIMQLHNEIKAIKEEQKIE